MSANSKIEWTDHTFNPWIGCTKVSPAESEDKRRGWTADGWGKGKPRKRTSAAYWKQPLKWNLFPYICGSGTHRFADPDCLGNPWCCECGSAITLKRPRVFCASLADWLDDEVPIEWLADLLALIHATPNLDWLLLTKRLENFMQRTNEVICHHLKARNVFPGDFCHWLEGWRRRGELPQNVWIGTSVEDQQRAEERIPKLLEIPARIRFLSCEPLLGSADLREHIGSGLDVGLPRIDWVIVGGESGAGARPCFTNWVRDIVAQCGAAGVAVFVKQLGSKPVCQSKFDTIAFRKTMRDRKGGDLADFPSDLRVREFPS